MSTKWEEAKIKVASLYTSLKPESEDFYRLALATYKDLTKTASWDECIDSLKKEGVLSKHASDKYYESKNVNEIQKFAARGKSNLKDSILTAGLTGLGSAAALAGGYAAFRGLTRGVQVARNAVTRKRRMEDIYKYHPSLRNADPEVMDEAMKTLERLNPEYANLPLVSGSALKGVIDWGGIPVNTANEIRDNTRGNVVTGVQDLFGKSLNDVYKDQIPRPEVKRRQKKTASNEQTEKIAASKEVKDTVRKALIGAGVATGLALGYEGGSKLVSKAYNSFTRTKRLNTIKSTEPSLKKVPSKQLETAMKTVERINNNYAHDPILGASAVKAIIKDKNKLNTANTIQDKKDENATSGFYSARDAFYGALGAK